MTAALTLEKYNTDFCLKSIIDKIYPIGKPVITLSDTLNENEIWIEGAEVSKTTYKKLYVVYGDTYGTPENDENFVLPDFRDRVLQGADGFGYLEAGLPNITGIGSYDDNNGTWSGCFYKGTSGGYIGDGSGTGYLLGFDASGSNSIYGNSDTVQPPAIKVRVKTRYE